MTTIEIQKKLREPFHPDLLGWRPITTSQDKTKAFASAYVDARTVQDRLDAVVGIEGWRTRYLQVGEQSCECRLSLFLPEVGWVAKADVGSTSDQPQAGDRIKAAYSDSFKRAAVAWGVGRYLYELGLTWCKYDAQRKQIIDPPALPKWALPTDYVAPSRNGQQQQQQAQAPQQNQQSQPDAKAVAWWKQFLETDPSIQAINNALQAFATLDQPTKNAIWKPIILAHARQAGLEFDPSRKIFFSTVQQP